MGVSVPRFLYGQLHITRGLGWLVMRAARSREPLHRLPVRMVDGRHLYLDLREPMCMSYLLDGRITEEAGETAFVSSVVRPGETVLDIGANVGWYTGILAEQVGPDGRVSAFEPNPTARRLLEALAADYRHLEIVPAAVSDFEGSSVLHLPLDGAQASLQRVPATASVRPCDVTTLDSFLRRRAHGEVTFVKCDAEGAEWSILQGCAELMSQDRPPMWMLEISVFQAARFGYALEDIFNFFESRATAGYQAFWIHSQTGVLEPLPQPMDFRFDAVFVPAWQMDRIASFPTARGARH